MLLRLYCCGVLLLGVSLYRGVLGNVAESASVVETGRERTNSRDPNIVVDGQRSVSDTYSCFSLFGANPALYVHLKKTVDVNFLLLYTSAEDEESVQDLLGGLEVFVGKEGKEEEEGQCGRVVRVGQHDKMARVEVICNALITGSRVTLRLPGRRRTLRLCEVEVYDTTCDCLNGCEVRQGFCFGGCIKSARCQRAANFAVFKQAESSALIDSSGPPSVVVNGNTGIIFVSRKDTEDVNEQNCIVTRSSDTSIALHPENSTLTSRKKRTTSSVTNINPWWSVNLETEMGVRGVVIYRGNAEQVWAEETLTEVSVDGQTCAKYGPETLSQDEALIPRLVVTCDDVIRGRKVKISRVRVSKTMEPTPLELWEVEVWGCVSGWFGDQCQSRCGRCRGGPTICDTVTGSCPRGCQTGWFGGTCQRGCSSGCVGQCEQDTGQCFQCLPNRALPFCKECVDGWYGSTCSKPCGQCGEGVACNKTTGHCDSGCTPGFLLPFCVEITTTTTTTSTTTTPISSPTSDGSTNDTRADENRDDDDSDVGVTIAAVVGAIAVVVAVAIVVFVCYRRRRGRLNTKRPTAAGPSLSGKPEATKTESFSYVDAMSSNHANSIKYDVTRDVTTDVVTHDVIGENCYEALDLSQYANMEDNTDDHVYIQPVFTRGASQSSNASGPYVNLGASTSSTE